MARVYVALTMDLLRRAHESGQVPEGAVRLTCDAEGDEVAEYAALQDAADESARLLKAPGRRVVLVAEVPSPDAPVAMSRVVAVHVDDVDLDPAGPAYDDPPELGWWATQEIPVLLGRD